MWSVIAIVSNNEAINDYLAKFTFYNCISSSKYNSNQSLGLLCNYIHSYVLIISMVVISNGSALTQFFSWLTALKEVHLQLDGQAQGS